MKIILIILLLALAIFFFIPLVPHTYTVKSSENRQATQTVKETFYQYFFNNRTY